MIHMNAKDKKAYNKQYYIDNKAKILAHQKQYDKSYYAANKDKISKRQKKYGKKYRSNNAAKIRAYHKHYGKQYRAANAEKIREYQKHYGKQYRAINADKLRAQKKQHRAANAEKIRKRNREPHAANVDKDPKGTWLKKTFGRAKARAKRRGLPYDEKCPDLEMPDVCPVLGIALIYPNALKNKRSSNSPSLDRLENPLGYVAVNLRVISFRANALKNDATVEAVIQYMKATNKGEQC